MLDPLRQPTNTTQLVLRIFCKKKKKYIKPKKIYEKIVGQSLHADWPQNHKNNYLTIAELPSPRPPSVMDLWHTGPIDLQFHNYPNKFFSVQLHPFPSPNKRNTRYYDRRSKRPFPILLYPNFQLLSLQLASLPHLQFFIFRSSSSSGIYSHLLTVITPPVTGQPWLW